MKITIEKQTVMTRDIIEHHKTAAIVIAESESRSCTNHGDIDKECVRVVEKGELFYILRDGEMIGTFVFCDSKLYSMHIYPEHRGLGVVKSVLDALPKPVFIDCHVNNGRASSAYFNAGCETIGSRMQDHAIELIYKR